MKHTEKIEVTKTDEIITKVTCDVCGKVLNEPIHYRDVRFLYQLDMNKFKKVPYYETWLNYPYNDGDYDFKDICKDCIHQDFEKSLEEINVDEVQFYQIKPTVGYVRK